ncbi:CatB-related O-acetyltransferase [Pseudophaeobacter arcticus]|uniref:CatB-related O-acetyltransferase n=1 Tax=Pseudophaeobacter arcticus TaxID=385492 RepID=UPI002491DE35|nr:CatB-related O-acetyltransferase [Pseudophaeobacter arcticus]
MLNVSSSKEAPLGNGRVEIGRFTYGYDGISFRNTEEGANVVIGSFCSIAEDVTIILGGQHKINRIATFPVAQVFQDEQLAEGDQGLMDVTIGNDVWIGHGVTIMPGVNIGDGAVIAATATVFKDVGPYEIWGGNPATFQRKRFEDDMIAALRKLAWWTLPEELIEEMAPLLSTVPNSELIEGLQAIVTDLVVFADGSDAAA